MPVRALQAELINIFKNWGVPEWIKVDNGRPFGDPQRKNVPLLALWLIGLDIQVIWNHARTPQQNAKVERSQGVLGNWTEYRKCRNDWELQLRLWKEADFHNHHFPISRKKHKKRIELFPTLHYTGKDWNPKDFQLQRVLNFLAKGSWQRKASKIGQISIQNKRYSVGIAYKEQEINFKLCAIQNHWLFFDSKGNLIKSMPTRISK